MKIDGLADMAVFARVVEQETFSAAAADLGLSKSAVSKRVSRLEDRLGVRLLNRTTRRLSLTEAGTAFYQGCRQVVADAELAVQAVSRLAAAPRGTLRVNAPVSFGVLHLMPALPDLLARYPELRIDVTLNDRVVDLVEEGFDVGIRIAVLEDSSLVARRLAANRRIVAASPAYVAASAMPEAPEDLAAHDCLIYAYQAGGPVWQLQGPGGRRSVRVKGKLEANNGDALLAAAVGGLGIVFLPSFICGDALRAGRLVRLLPDWADEDSAVHAVYPAARNLSPKVRVFVDFLAERCAATPYWDRGIA